MSEIQQVSPATGVVELLYFKQNCVIFAGPCELEALKLTATELFSVVVAPLLSVRVFTLAGVLSKLKSDELTPTEKFPAKSVATTFNFIVVPSIAGAAHEKGELFAVAVVIVIQVLPESVE